jgi:rieske iron-sulfur protein
VNQAPCQCARCTSAAQGNRRRVIRISAIAGLAFGLAPWAALPAHAQPQAGDYLVADDTEGDPVPLTAADVKSKKPLLAYPYNLAGKKVRNESRLSKVVLVRVAESDAALDVESKARSAAGVLAFSAVCTHQACDVKTWVAADSSLICFCHSSKFLPLEGGRVAAGPAPRALPSLPLALREGRLIIAGTFSAAVGPSQ